MGFYTENTGKTPEHFPQTRTKPTSAFHRHPSGTITLPGCIMTRHNHQLEQASRELPLTKQALNSSEGTSDQWAQPPDTGPEEPACPPEPTVWRGSQPLPGERVPRRPLAEPHATAQDAATQPCTAAAGLRGNRPAMLLAPGAGSYLRWRQLHILPYFQMCSHSRR